MSFIPGVGIAKGMATTLRRFFGPRATIQYPETAPDVAVRFRGRLQLLYDEWGALKCETCFQCAQACPVECIDMGGYDTMGRFHVHWGRAETYGERREESAIRRAGRPVPDPAFSRFDAVDDNVVDGLLAPFEFDPRQMLGMLGAIQNRFGYLPVGALKRLSQISGAPYAYVYGTASYYKQFKLERPLHVVGVCRCTACALAGSGRLARVLARSFGTDIGGAPTNGGIALRNVGEHAPGQRSPLVTLDGQPQSGVNLKTAAGWAASVVGGVAPSTGGAR